ncbi:MAG: helix-turn-helix domain-containing protein [Actinomycetota bacterium]
MAAATSLFGSRGFQAVSIDDICSAVGLSRGGFYHHFSNREACFEAVWLSLQAQWGEHSRQLAATYDENMNAWELIEHSFRDLFTYWAEPARRQINLYDPIPALGWDRILELTEAGGQSEVAEMLRELGKRDDPLTARLITAAITDATFHVGHLGCPDDVRDRAASTLVDLIRGLPDLET